MNYWWVNQGQTYEYEVGQGYMWSPKLQQDGKRHFSYEYMKHIKPGDIVFSYSNTAIQAVGISKTYCYSFPKPMEFGKAGIYWSDEGWKVDVRYGALLSPVRTMDHIETLRPFLPSKYSPMKSQVGSSNLAYLFKIDKELALAIARLIDQQTVDLVNSNYVTDSDIPIETIAQHINDWEDQIVNIIIDSDVIEETEKMSLVKARRGQGKYREQLLMLETRCRITGVDIPEHLIASHIKPWRSSNNNERLDPENGFMHTPTIDHLFDKGFISFENDGSILLADVADRVAMEQMGVIGEGVPTSVGHLSSGQKHYLEWHRESILLR